MENQHRMIRGYRDLSPEEIDLINEIKRLESRCLDAVSKAQALIKAQRDGSTDVADVEARHAIAEPGRWATIAKTELQQGFMALVRSVAQPV